RRVQIAALIAAAMAVIGGASVGLAVQGAIWAFPLADLVWWFDVVMLTEGLIATLFAIAIGLPGCEIGVWSWLVSRFRGTSALFEGGLACIVGLHVLDEWEARRLPRAIT